MNSWLVTYIVGGMLLSVIDFKFSGDPPRPTLDKVLAIICFKILWPIGLLIFILKWYQGRSYINGRRRGE